VEYHYLWNSYQDSCSQIKEIFSTVNLILFDFDKTIINKDTGAEYMKFMVQRNPIRFVLCFFALPFTLPFLILNKTKFIGFSVLLWLVTCGMSPKKIVTLRKHFINRYLENKATVIYKNAIEQLISHAQNKDRVVIVSGASEWMVKRIIVKLCIPMLEFACSEETRLAGGMVSKFHCYSTKKVERIKMRYNLEEYETIIGYSDSSIDIPLLRLCNQQIIVNPKPNCGTKLTKSFGKSMKIVKWV
jgi:phosphatidylglycerophosphatase C